MNPANRISPASRFERNRRSGEPPVARFDRRTCQAKCGGERRHADIGRGPAPDQRQRPEQDDERSA